MTQGFMVLLKPRDFMTIKKRKKNYVRLFSVFCIFSIQYSEVIKYAV